MVIKVDQILQLLTGAIAVCRMNGDRIGLQHCMAFVSPCINLISLADSRAVLCIDCPPPSGDRSHSSIRFSRTSTLLKYCLTSRSSCKYKMCPIFQSGGCTADEVFQEQPLSASFEKIYQFIGWYDQWIDLHGNILRQRDQDAFHAVHSLIWSIAGRCFHFGRVAELSGS